MSNKNISNTAPIGARNISRSLEKISFSPEVSDLLAYIGGTIQMRFSPDSASVTHTIIDAEGNFLATIQEFEQLAGYKTFIRKKQDELERKEGSDKRATTYKNAILGFTNRHGEKALPSRILESNNQKFAQLKKSLKDIEKNRAVINSLPSDKYRDYLSRQGRVLERIYMKQIEECMGSSKVEKAEHARLLLGCGVPKYLDSKFTDSNFTRDLARTNSAKTLIFPKGNYMKSISFTTEEMNDNAFLGANLTVISNSGSIIQLARSEELIKVFIDKSDEHVEELLGQWSKLLWPLLSPGNCEDFLQPRVDRIRVKPYSEVQAPKAKPGGTVRPETALQKKSRALKNSLGTMISIILDFFHLIPRVTDPREDFWSELFTSSVTDNWTVTPERPIYHWVADEPNCEKVVDSIRNNSSDKAKKLLGVIVCIGLKHRYSGTKGTAIQKIIGGLGENDKNTSFLGDVDTEIDAQPDSNLQLLEEEGGSLSQAELNKIDVFRGKVTEDLTTSTKEKRFRNKVRLTSEAKATLKHIKDKVMRNEVASWIRESFRNKALQRAAADFTAGMLQDLSLVYETDGSESDSEEEE